MRNLLRKPVALNGPQANWSFGPRVKNHFSLKQGRRICGLVRRLTLWSRLRWANPELVEFPAPSRPAQRDVAKTHVLQASGL